MSEHTPTPWRVEYDKTDPRLAMAIRCEPDLRDAGTFVCEMFSSRGPAETAANARLISQAPAMFEKLAAIEEDWPWGEDEEINGGDLVDYMAEIVEWIRTELQPAVEGKEVPIE